MFQGTDALSDAILLPISIVNGTSWHSLTCRDLILNKTKIVVAHASSAYKHSLREVLESSIIAGQIKASLDLPHHQFEHTVSSSNTSLLCQVCSGSVLRIRTHAHFLHQSVV